MTSEELREKLISGLADPLPLPAGGKTAERHRRLMEIGRDDLSLARLAEAHWDAIAILAEAGRSAVSGSLYGVWAAEKPGQEVRLEQTSSGFVLNGTKMFCSGAGIVDRALVTTAGSERLLVEVDLRASAGAVLFDTSAWKSAAFRETGTATANFRDAAVPQDAIVGTDGWYTGRPGFWRGACGPAACWAGGAAALADYALTQSRRDPHSLAHLGAMRAEVWALEAYLERAGHAIDEGSERGNEDTRDLQVVALTMRHLVEQASTDILRRLPRAYGPHPLAFDPHISQQYQELDLYLRQSHAERDLGALGAAVLERQELARNRQSLHA